MMEEAEISSTTGTITYLKNGSRKQTNVKTKVGSTFTGTLALEPSEYADICQRAQMVIPPIPTTFNGTRIVARKPIREFDALLPTEASDASGILRPLRRKTKVRLYKVLSGETPTLYEQGLPVVETDIQWHVDVQQRLPLNTERNNVTPAYHKAISIAVVNEMHAEISEEHASENWVRTATSSKHIDPKAYTKVMATRFGEDAVLEDTTDEGSDKEATSHGVAVVPRGALSAGEKANAKKHEVLLNSSKAQDGRFSTKCDTDAETIQPEQHTEAMKDYGRLIEAVASILISHTVKVRFVDDERAEMIGCTLWAKDSFIFTVNLAYHGDCSNWAKNYELLLHELAHHRVQNNDHLRKEFYETVTALGAKLAQLALDKPELFALARPVAVAAG